MAGSDYNLNNGWTQQSNPQLENEFDPNSYNVVADSAQRFGRRQGTQDLSYPAYQQQYAAAPQQSFTFSVPARQVDQAYDGSSFFDQQASTSAQPQDTRQFTPQRNVYGTPSTLQGVHIAPGMYRDNSQGYSYSQHQPSDIHLGQSQGPIEPSSITPTHHEFDTGNSAQQGQPPPPSVFVSPPPAGYDHLYQSPPQDRPVDPQLGAHRTNLPFFATTDTVQDASIAPAAKRQRAAEDAAANYSGDGPDQDPENKGEVQRPKPAGACARCKGLKVRCEFITDPDICKRCLNGGHECVIPGRKKRRPPPKREHLLTQIREQATQIKTLMAQLEEVNQHRADLSQSKEPLNAPSPTHSATNTDRLSSVSLPTSSSYTSFVEVDDASEARSTAGENIVKPDVLDWIAKARASLEEFGGYLSMGGPSATRGMLGGEEDELDGSPGMRTPGGEFDEFEFAVVDDEDIGTQTELGLGADGALSDQYLSGDEGSTLAIGRRHLVPPRSATPSEASFRRASTTDKLANIPHAAAPIGFFAQLMAQRRRRGSRPNSDIDEDDRGLANDEFFKPSPATNRPFFDDGEQYPRILKEGVVSPREVESLFKIYWDYMNLSVSLLDPELYSSQKTFVRSPFLFTVICGIASKYYEPRPDLYQKLMRYARQAAGEALIGGRKSVEVVQAYILLALYPVPCRRWGDDRSWVYLGLAIRIASDLNLHHPNTATPKNEQHGREMLNRTRAWLNCFNLDRSTGSQYGKPPTISNADYMANQSGAWWNSSQWNMKNFDIHIAGYNAELRVMARFSLEIRGDANNPSGINKTVDVAKIALATDEELAGLWDHWNSMIEANNDPEDAQGRFRNGLLRLAYSYARLTALSWGFQFGFGKKGSVSTDRRLLWSAYRAAKDTVRAYIDHIGIPSQRIYLRHGPEAQSVFITFACAFLVKLMQPKFAPYLTREQRVDARSLVQQVIDVLGSPEVAVDDGHYPKLYSRFLKGLLDTPMADVDRPVPIIKRESPIQEQRALAKAKSVSPATQTHELFRSASPSRGTSSTPSSARASQTPPPMPDVNDYDQFGHIPMNTDAYSHSMLLSNDLPNVDNQYFAPLLPFDSELLQSMQSLTDPVAWPEMIMPGFAWMSGLHQTDSEMS